MKTLIVNGHLIDPKANRNGQFDILIENGKVIKVCEDLKDQKGESDLVIDAAGKIVSPGFIDIHMHEDPVGPDGKIEYCIFENMLRMGVTTCVGGNCGSTNIDPVEYMDIIDRDGAPCNVAMLAGEISCREKAGALNKYEKATPEQRESIKAQVKKALDGGCAGLSYGVRYAPGADQEELMAAASACEESGKIIASHVRDDAEGIFDAIKEMADLGIRYHLPVQISHIGSMGGFGQMKDVLSQMMSYREQGLDLAMDCYPYEAFSTEIGATTYDDGWMERYHCDYSVLEFSEGKYKGQRANEESFRYMRENDPNALTVCYVMRKEDVDQALSHPMVCLGSDGILDHGQGHPRSAGSFPRFIDHYVRSGVVDLQDAIRKMTAMAAERMNLNGKGTLKEGADGDVVIFDFDKIKDNATFKEPMLPPDGIDFVLINGEIACEGTTIRENLKGRSVRV